MDALAREGERDRHEAVTRRACDVQRADRGRSVTVAGSNRCCAAKPGGAKGSEPAGCGRGAQAMLLVTGGAGFIGSNVVASLNVAGRADVVVNDRLGCDEKWRNLAKRELADFIPPEDLLPWLAGRTLDAVIHLGAISDTTARDGDRVVDTNFRLSLQLLDWCTQTQTPFIYASSAATYGDGSDGFDDDESLPALRRLRPLNLYGWSKHLFDLAVVSRARRGEPMPPQWVGLKFFNVFGPNEYHKGEMMSLIAKRFQDARDGQTVRLFKSHRQGIADGDQRRDFIYVDDAVAVLCWFFEFLPHLRPVQCRHGRGAQLPRHDHGDVLRARPQARHRLCRDAGRHPRSVPVFHPGFGRETAQGGLHSRVHAARNRRRALCDRLPRPA